MLTFVANRHFFPLCNNMITMSSRAKRGISIFDQAVLIILFNLDALLDKLEK